MKPIATRIHDGAIKLHCLTYRSGYRNFIRDDRGEWPTTDGVQYIIPPNIRVNHCVEVGHQDGKKEVTRKFKVFSIDSHRIKWSRNEVNKIWFMDGQVDHPKTTVSAIKPVKAAVKKIEAPIEAPSFHKVLEKRGADLRQKNFHSEAWFNSIAKELGIFGYQWNFPIADKYIADFIWVRERVILEMDGSSHVPERNRSDQARQTFLESLGYAIIRIDYPPIANWKDRIRSLLAILHEKKLKMLEGL